MGTYFCKDGTRVELVLSEDGSSFVIAEGTNEEDKAKFWAAVNEIEKQQANFDTLLTNISKCQNRRAKKCYLHCPAKHMCSSY